MARRDAAGSRTRGFIAAAADSFIALSRVFSASLGPFGARKALIGEGGRVSFVKDGFTIASSLKGEGLPSAFAIDIAKALDDTCGDGVSSAITLAGGLLRNALALIEDGVHPSHIIEGYRAATEDALGICDARARREGIDAATLKGLASTCLGTKLPGRILGDAAGRVSNAVARAAESGWLVPPRHGAFSVSWLAEEGGEAVELIDGVVLDKAPALIDMPERLDKPKVALLDSLELQLEGYDVVMDLRSPTALGAMISEERSVLDGYLDRLKELGVMFVACRGGIEDHLERRMAGEGMLAVKNVSEADLAAIGEVTGAEVVLRGKVTCQGVGEADAVHVLGRKEWRKVVVEKGGSRGIPALLVRMGNGDEAAEVAKALKSAIRLLEAFISDRRVLPGGGVFDAEVSIRLRKAAESRKGRARLAYEAFSRALLAPVEALVENAGLDSAEIISRLLAEHRAGKAACGIDLEGGRLENRVGATLVEPAVLKRQIIVSASEAARAIIGCDGAYYARRMVKTPPRA